MRSEKIKKEIVIAMNRNDMMFELETLLRTVFRQLKSEIGELFRSELTGNEFRILAMLDEGGAIRVTDLSKRLQVSASHITAVTDGLLEKGFIDRKKSPSDRRSVEISLTEAGKKVFKQLEEKKSEYFRGRFSHFTTEELLIMMTLFKKLNEPEKDERN
jgi:DNA-binding MarR family transcriptional regulator